MAVKVLDSWALIAFFENEPAAGQVERLLVNAGAGRHKLLLSAVNWGEVYYITMREISQEVAEQTVKEIAGLAIEIVGIGADNMDLVRQAAIFKATRKISYADAFAAALAKMNNAELVTGDREFEGLEGELKIEWLR